MQSQGYRLAELTQGLVLDKVQLEQILVTLGRWGYLKEVLVLEVLVLVDLGSCLRVGTGQVMLVLH